MRKTSVALLALGLAAVSLTGCAAGPSFDGAACDRTGSAHGVDALATVTGPLGSEPKVDLYSPLRVEETSFADLIVGDGAALTAPGQLMVVDMVLYNGTTGERLVATPFNGDLSRVTGLNDWAGDLPGIASVMECATGGSRVLAAISPEDFGETPLAAFQLAPDDTVVAVIDISKTYLPAADGAPQFTTGTGLPTVVRAVTGQPGVVLPANTAPPTELVTQVLLRGSGDPVTAEDSFRAHYTGVLWSTGEVFDSSWDRGTPQQFTLDGVIPGFAQALEGQTVGSQVMIVVPPELGYGDAGSGRIPGGSTLVFVVDILGIDAALAG